jgi:hypothetical protein
LWHASPMRQLFMSGLHRRRGCSRKG